MGKIIIPDPTYSLLTPSTAVRYDLTNSRLTELLAHILLLNAHHNAALVHDGLLTLNNNLKLKDVDASPVDDRILKIIDGYLRIRNSGDSTDAELHLNSIPANLVGKNAATADSALKLTNTVFNTSDQASTTSYADVTSLGFSLLANTRYHFEYNIPLTFPGSSFNLYMGVNGPASPIYLRYNHILTVKDFTISTVASDIYDPSVSVNLGTVTVGYIKIVGTISNGSNAGTLIPRIKHTTAAFTALAGSMGTLIKLA